ncbi:hypothetical protein ACHAXS_009451 [Conticribra weissflogii]
MVLGGFTDSEWSKLKKSHSDSSRAFLFVLSGNDVTTPFRMNIRQDVAGIKGIYTAFRGPWFGGATQGFNLKVTEQRVLIKFGGAYQAAPSGMFAEKEHNKAIKLMEVYQVTTGFNTACANPTASSAKVDVSKNVYDAMDYKRARLTDLKYDIESLENAFQEEGRSLSFFADDANDEDIVTLNVSGTKMMVAKNTLTIAKKSYLASQIAHWGKTNEIVTPTKTPKEWNHEDVVAWMNRIEGVPESVISIFAENQISGRELVALGKEGMIALGMTRIGTIFLLLDEIKQSEKGSVHKKEIHIDHSPYCFEKIVDQLRLMRAYADGQIESKPPAPVVRECEKERFEKLVNHYFPDDSSRSIDIGSGKIGLVEF